MTLNSYIDGIIVRIISNLYTVKCDNVFVDCQARGKFRNMGLTPLVGDRVKVDIDNKYIIELNNGKYYKVSAAQIRNDTNKASEVEKKFYFPQLYKNIEID